MFRAGRVYHQIGQQTQTDAEQEIANNINCSSRDTLNNNNVDETQNFDGNANNIIAGTVRDS